MKAALLVAVLVLVSACGKNDNFIGRGQVPPPGFGPNGPVPPGQYNPYGNPYGQPGGPWAQQPYGNQMNPYNRFAPPPQYGNPGMVPFAPMQQYLGPQWDPFWNQWQQYSRMRGYNQYDIHGFWNDFCPSIYGGNMPYWYQEMDRNWYYWVDGGYSNYSYGQDFWSGYGGYPLPCSSCEEFFW